MVLTIVGVLIVAGGASAGVFALLSRSDKPGGNSTAGDADAIFASAPNAASDGSQQTIADVAAVGDTVVAAGAESGSALSRPRFLVSPDAGRTWEVADIKTESGARPGGAIPYKIVGTAGAWLALGRTSDHFAAWTSTNGRSWLKVRDGASAFAASDQLQQIARSAQAYIAIGHRTAANKPESPVIWLSADGKAWQRLEGGKLRLPVGKGSVTRLNYVAAAGDNMIISGEIQRSGGKQDPIAALWRSADHGRTWKSVEPPQADGAFGTTHLAATPAGFFAVRKSKDGSARNGQVSHSTDGANWQTKGQFPLSAGESENFQQLAGSDQGLAALVTAPGNRLSVYRSGDGTTWQPATDLGAATGRTIGGLAVTGGGTAIVGGFQQGSDSNFYLNRIDESGRPGNVDLTKVQNAVNTDRSVQAIVSGGSRIVAVGSANGDAASWTSEDGVTWSRSNTNALSGAGLQSFTDVAQGAQRWIAVGKDGAKPVIATSDNASSWQRFDVSGLMPEKDGITLNSAAGGPKGYVVAGWKGTNPQASSAVAWHSADLKTWKPASGEVFKNGKNSSPKMLDVTGTSTGYVGVGEVVNPSAPAEKRVRPEVWTSSDGLQWKAQEPGLPKRMLNGQLTHVSVNGSTVAALGKGWIPNAGYRPFAAISKDSGLTWSTAELPLSASAKPTDVSITALAATSTGFAAVGTTDGATDEDVALWTSSDGQSWQSSNPRGPAVSGPGIQRITGLAVVKNELLGVGLTADARTQHVTLWRGPGG